MKWWIVVGIVLIVVIVLTVVFSALVMASAADRLSELDRDGLERRD